MTRDTITKINWTRIGTALGALALIWGMLVALRSEGDDRYVQKSDYHTDIAQMRADLRVLRCRVAGDCE